MSAWPVRRCDHQPRSPAAANTPPKNQARTTGRHHLGAEVAAVTAIGIGGLVASPGSRSHYWVWLAPALMALRVERRWALFPVTAEVTYLAPIW